MNPTADEERANEQTRVGRIYAGYRRSRGRRRAWAAQNPGNRAIRLELREAALREAGPPLAAGGAVLDVGCGNGFWLAELHAFGVAPARLTGVDVLPDRVAAAARRMPGASIQQADARALPFERDSFALVLLFTVLSSLASPADARRALLEARRVLRPSGLLLCYEPRLPNPLNGRARRVRSAEFDEAGIRPRAERRLTLLPPLARRLGAHTETAYPRLARIPFLRSHRLVCYRKGRDEPLGPEADRAGRSRPLA